MSDELTVPAFPNRYPYNELLLDGKLLAKTRIWRWKHRGLTLLYTSSRADHEVVLAHGLELTGFTKGIIVGCADLVDVRELTMGERVELFRAFNNIKSKSVARRRMRTDGNSIWPFPIGFFFEDLCRFDEPIPFKPPRGAMRTFRVPIELVAEQLQKLGHGIE
ncbi:MAG: hypothetical protein U9Q03_06090 [Patescibacteria group bacterium]|nr:hypothetical protein [Patescibacteria group bacterium]